MSVFERLQFSFVNKLADAAKSSVWREIKQA